MTLLEYIEQREKDLTQKKDTTDNKVAISL